MVWNYFHSSGESDTVHIVCLNQLKTDRLEGGVVGVEEGVEGISDGDAAIAEEEVEECEGFNGWAGWKRISRRFVWGSNKSVPDNVDELLE